MMKIFHKKMKQSLTYYITLLIIKLKGLKKNFNQDPISYQKLRREDLYRPKGKFFRENISRYFQIAISEITEIKQKSASNKLLIFIHGGAFISGPGEHHWDAIKKIAQNTEYTIWMCNYPKAPEYQIPEISKNIDAIYNEALKEFNPNHIRLIGDSVGGTLLIALTQRLLANNKPIPNKLILISPVMDASMSNVDIDKLEVKDPILSKAGLISAKNMCAGDTDLKDVMISPLYGSFKKFPKTIMYLAENDITYPDQKLLVEQLKTSNVDFKWVVGKNMPHIWPLLPIMKEAKSTFTEIIEVINNK